MCELSEEEKKALKDCDIIFMCLEDMMSEESANDARKSYKIIRNLIENQQKEIEELKEEYNTKLLSNAGIYQLGFNDGIKTVEGKIKAKIEELEKEQENNRKSLYNAINILYFKEIDKISNRICVNMTTRDILQSLLEEE